MKKLISLLLLTIIAATANANGVEVDGIYYLFDGTNATVTYPGSSAPSSGNNSYTGAIVIPATVTYNSTTYNVTAIGDYAFQYSTITSISLPEGLLSIGYKSIYNTHLTTITVPNSVISTDYESFGYNSLLEEIYMGENIATNTWGDKLCYSGIYKNIYLYCKTVPALQSYTFSFAGATVHVYPSMVNDFKSVSAWNSDSYIKIVGDLAPRNYTELQEYITYYESVTPSASYIGTSFGQYSAESVTNLTNAINTAKGLDNTASLADIESAAAGMYTAYNNLYIYPLEEGYYYIRCEYYTNYVMYTDASAAETQGIKTQTFTESKMNTVDYLKYCFKFTKNGENWNIQSAENGLYFGTSIGQGDQKYISLTETPTYQQVLTPISPEKIYIQSIYDDNSLTYPYSYYNYRVMTWKSEHKRRYWSIHPLPVEVPDVEVIDGIAEIAQSGITALAARIAVLQAKFNGATAVDFSGSTFASDVTASTLQADAGNMVVIVPASSSITGQNIVKSGICSNLVLTEGKPFGASTDFTATTATYSRDITNAWGTICLPYEVESNDDVTYYTTGTINDDVLTLTSADVVPAGTPAIFKAAGSSITAAGSNVSVKGAVQAESVTNDDITLVGSFTKQTILATEVSNAYYISGGKFWHATGTLTVNPFRAYFTTNSASPSNGFSITVDDDNVTAIQALTGESDVTVTAIYTADGKQIGELQNGLNIVKLSNGKTKKIMIK